MSVKREDRVFPEAAVLSPENVAKAAAMANWGSEELAERWPRV